MVKHVKGKTASSNTWSEEVHDLSKKENSICNKTLIVKYSVSENYTEIICI